MGERQEEGREKGESYPLLSSPPYYCTLNSSETFKVKSR
jgi:hypothetical protein